MNVQELLDREEIRAVTMAYARGIDRIDMDLVRSCYHPDATDHHGHYRGGVDGFVSMCAEKLHEMERTMHFLGNQTIELDGDRAWVETYCVAYHRLKPAAGVPAKDMTLGLRYVDRFERRGGPWKIADRVCAWEWSRIDPVGETYVLPEDSFFGLRNRGDIIYRR
ncbi:MAG: nuclear transport factor 2 family protein [Gammaproteobacteria bacterium]